jgi:glutamyl-tRNA reductase
MLSRASRQNLLDHRNSAEQIRRREVSRVLRKLDLSSEGVEGIERLGCALVDRIFVGPIAKAMARLEKRTYQGGPGGYRAISTSGTSPRGMAHKKREP